MSTFENSYFYTFNDLAKVERFLRGGGIAEIKLVKKSKELINFFFVYIKLKKKIADLKIKSKKKCPEKGINLCK